MFLSLRKTITRTLPILLLSCGTTALLLHTVGLAAAQDSATGAIEGRIRDSGDETPVEGVSVVATSIQRNNQHSVTTDSEGRFKLSSLLPGDYQVILIRGEIVSPSYQVRVRVNAASQLYAKLGADDTGETYVAHGGSIDTSSSAKKSVLDRLFLESLPVPGRTFDSALGASQSAESDDLGFGYSGGTSLENQYIVNGINTTGLGYGTVGSPLSTEFVDQIEVLTGGYMAEHGRSTGGIINLVTQSGTNEFHGSVFTMFTNSLLQKRTARAPTQSWVDLESNLAYDLSIGAKLGGPIIKDKLWFFVGVAPRFIANDTERITKRQTDCRRRLDNGKLSECRPGDESVGGYSDGVPDEDDFGFRLYDELDRQTLTSQTTETQFISKINYSPNQNNSGQITFSGTPFIRESPGIAGEVQAVGRETQVLTTDIGAKWTSKFNDAKTTLEAVVGMHRSAVNSGSIDPRANDIASQTLLFGNFGEWAQGSNQLSGGPRESAATIAGCSDSLDREQDPYQLIDNCPDNGIGYRVGGIGTITDQEEQRLSGKLSLIHRIEAAGYHEIKAGIDFENNFLNRRRKLSGDAQITNYQDRDQIDVFRFVALAPEGSSSDQYPDQCDRLNSEGPIACDYTPPGDVKGHTLNVAGYVQDSWQLRPNLTINAGMRYEEQRLRNAEHLIGQRAQGTGQLLGKNAMVLDNMWSPRLGLSYDWSKEGRSKLYGSWGRYYESVPLNLNDRSFGAESGLTSTYESDSCGPSDKNLGGAVDGIGCLSGGIAPTVERLNGSGVLVASGVQAQYLDEAILGVEYEFLEDLKVGISYQNRRIGRILEDLSTDNAQTYILANPGQWSQEEENKLLRKIENEAEPEEKERLQNELTQFRGIRNYDRARRDYNALSVTVSKRFAQNFFVESSYTYARTEGNYQGLFSSSSGQVDPNITSLFDLPELMANRDGALPQDRPHSFKFDGFYSFDLKEAGAITTGLSLRAFSGSPINVSGAHYRYGQNETMLIPRASKGRIALDYNASIHVGYKRAIGNRMQLEGFVDFFNLNALGFLGGQNTATVDETYTFSSVNPIVGGRYQDLVFLKELNQANGAETAAPTSAIRNRNFGQATSLASPPAARIGARLSF